MKKLSRSFGGVDIYQAAVQQTALILCINWDGCAVFDLQIRCVISGSGLFHLSFCEHVYLVVVRSSKSVSCTSLTSNNSAGDQCALDAKGNAMAAEDITFYDSESDEHPIRKAAPSRPKPPSPPPPEDEPEEVLGTFHDMTSSLPLLISIL